MSDDPQDEAKVEVVNPARILAYHRVHHSYMVIGQGLPEGSKLTILVTLPDDDGPMLFTNETIEEIYKGVMQVQLDTTPKDGKNVRPT